MNAQLSPFIFGRSLSPTEFGGRGTELNRLAGRLFTGQSIAVIGQPHIGKTSLLEFMNDENARQNRFEGRFARHFFVFLDILAAQGIRLQGDFWRHVLSPLRNSEYAT